MEDHVLVAQAQGAELSQQETGGFCPLVLGSFLLKTEGFLRGSATVHDGLLRIAEEVSALNLAYAMALIKMARYNGLGQSWYFYAFERMVYAAMRPPVVVRSHG